MKRRRLPVVIVLVGLLVAAIVVGNRASPSTVGVTESVGAASIPSTHVRSSVWYCSGGPTGSGPSPDRVTMSNVSARTVPVVVGAMVAGRAVHEQIVRVGARSGSTLAVAQLSSAPAAAIVAQPLGAGITVAQGYSVNADTASVACATRAAAKWFFAAGSTVTGAQLWVSVLNPHNVDTVVDISAYTEDGLRSPSALQELVVHKRSRLVVRVDHAVAQQKNVALEVHVANGPPVVATQSIVRPRGPKANDVSMSLGALAPARQWIFADNRSRAGASTQLVLSAPGETDATVHVQVIPARGPVVQPRDLRVPTASATALDLSKAVPAGVSYSIVVRSPVPVVAETRTRFDSGQSRLAGLVTEVGTPVASPRWWFAGGPFTETGLGAGGVKVTSGHDLAVVMKTTATQQQIDDTKRQLDHDGHVTSVDTVNRSVTRDAFLAANRGNPSLLGTPISSFPVVFQVATKSTASIAVLRQRFSHRAGVDEIISAANEGPRADDDIVVFNPGARSAHVTVVASAGGQFLTAPGLRSVEVGAGRQVTISLLALTHTGAAAVVTATRPVVVERFVAGPAGTTRSPGVPGP